MKTMKTIAFLNIKGGVGKTTSVTTLGHILATVFKRKTLIIDLDPQSNTTSTYCSGNEDFSERFRAVLAGEVYEMENSVSTLLLNRSKDVHSCIRKTEYENLDIIPADLSLSTVEERLKADVSSPQQFRLARHLKKIEDEYDFCLLDCGPSVSIINVNGLAAADEVYIPIRTDGYSLLGLAFAKNLVDNVSEYNPKLKFAGTFFVAWENFNCPKYLYDLLDECLPGSLLLFQINKSILLAENTVMARPLLEVDNTRNPGKASRQYIELARYISADEKEREKILASYSAEERKGV